VDVVPAVEGLVLSLGASPWVLLAVLVLTTVDGFFPPVPSESLVIAVAALSVGGDGPTLWALVLVAAVGALAGDMVAHTIGRRAGGRAWPGGRRGRAALEGARRRLAHSGGTVVLTARFVPVGRVAVNMAAGAVGYPRPRFLKIAAVGAAAWALCSTTLGVVAGAVLEEHPLAAVAVGVLGGLALGVAVDALVRRTTPARPTRPTGR
jgi:membrane protein DedA with SNARE-associated domain